MSEMVPKVRFQGFTDDWEDRKLNEVAIFYNGQRIPIDSSLRKKGKYPYYGATGIIDYVEDYIFDGEFVLLAEDGANITMRNSPIAYLTQGKFWLNNHAHIMAMKDGSNNFLVQLLEKQNYEKYNSGTAQPKLNSQVVKSLNFLFPTKEEQQKIGSFFKQLDDTIALHQRKLDLLKEQKKGFLQKMFPKNGSRVPELRFSGFADDWEERKLGELSNIVGGGTPSTSNPEYWDGDIDWYAPAEIGEQSYVSKSKKTITELGLKKSSARILPVGTVLFTSRAGIGNTAILAKEATTNQGFQSIVPDQNKLDSYFIFSRTNELKRYGEVTGAGSTFVEVSGKQMSKMSIMVPELSEQQKIGSFFKQLDDTIALHQRKLDSLKEQKKGFLQKMFVS